jgi:predicted metallo-beta-lactamase superfamily hydrolase
MSAIQVIPIGFESLGVRSMCTYVETPDVRLLIDAGVALGPRFRKMPHPLEYLARAQCRARIREYAQKASVIVVSHYHNDHHTPNYAEPVWLGSSLKEAEQIYRDKIVLAKDARNAINFSQRRRGWMFQRFLKKIGSKCEIADGRIFEYGATRVKISPPVPHGEEQGELGWLIMTSIESKDETLLHASDVQGPMSAHTMRLIAKGKPDLAIVGGPPLYLEGFKVEKASIQTGVENAAKLAAKVPTMIFEHHVLRSENWQTRAKPVFEAAEKRGHRVLTAADHLGVEPRLLESRRERLYIDDPPSEDFLKWCALPREKRRLQPPPVQCQ